MSIRKINCAVYLLVLVIFGSCSELSKEQKSCWGTIISPLQIQNSLSFNDLIDSVFFVKLESNKNAFFGDITQLEILNDTIIIFDYDNNLVLTFDLNGNFIRNIGSVGGGPNERMGCLRISIDKKKHEILLLDTRKSRIFHYRLSGDFKSSEKTYVFPSDFIVKNDQYIFCQNESPIFFDQEINYNLLITKGEEIVQKYFSFSENDFNYVFGDVFYEFLDTICYIDHWNSDVYSILDGKLKPRFSIDFAGNDIPLEFTKSEDLFLSNKEKYSILYSDFIESDTHVFFQYSFKGHLQKVLYNKLEKSYCTFPTDNKINDIGAAFFSPCYCYNGNFISVLEPSHLVHAYEMGVTNKMDYIKNDKIKRIATEVKADDNLLLAFYKFKTK